MSGWGLVESVVVQTGKATTPGGFLFTADPSHILTVALQTLVSTKVVGPIADFDPARAYVWPAVRWDGGYNGPGDAAALAAATTFDTAGVPQPDRRRARLELDAGGHTLSLTYTPVPEPGTLGLAGLARRADRVAQGPVLECPFRMTRRRLKLAALAAATLQSAGGCCPAA